VLGCFVGTLAYVHRTFCLHLLHLNSPGSLRFPDAVCRAGARIAWLVVSEVFKVLVQGGGERWIMLSLLDLIVIKETYLS